MPRTPSPHHTTVPLPRADGQVALESTSAHLDLAVSSNGICSPGSTLQATVRVKGERNYESLSLRLVATTKTTLMGKSSLNRALRQWTMTSAGVAPPPSTESESVAFVDEEIPLEAPRDPSSSADPKDAPQSPTSPLPIVEGTYTADVGLPLQSELLPHIAKRETLRETGLASMDTAGASVSWSLQLEGKRKGRFKSNDRLLIAIPVVFPSAPWCFAYDDTALFTKELKFESGDAAAPSVEAKLVFQCPTISAAPIHFTLSVTPASSAHSSLLSTLSSATIDSEAFLIRELRTGPVVKVDVGRDYAWPAVRVAMGQVERVDGTTEEGALAWTGTVWPPQGECTVESRAIGIKYFLGCKLSSPLFADGFLRVVVPVFLPSSPVDIPAQDGGAHVPHDEHALPEYAP
ncbi:hypothetical protein JCM8097_001982 [Rhodosporidiobolus ruineniae]